MKIFKEEICIVILLIDELSGHEGSLIDFTSMGEDAESIVECIHQITMKELLSRTLLSMWGWEVRTIHMFAENHLQFIRDIIFLPLGKVNRLLGCGYVTRKEVYEVFEVYHLRLRHWTPDLHWSKTRYIFKGE